MSGASEPAPMTLRFATDADVDAIAALHAGRISEGFLVTLGPSFLRRLYRRIVRSSGAFVLVADGAGGPARPRPVRGFIAVADNTGALYREFLLHDGVAVALAATRGVLRAPRPMWETLRYGLADGTDAPGAEVLATAVAAECVQRGVGTRLVRTAVEEMQRRGAVSARVVTAVGNVGAVRAYEHGGFHACGIDEVHRGVPQQLLVWP
ncbi:MAG: GNAT family N-acetyltransferase [Acidimicrobiia bacterium]